MPKLLNGRKGGFEPLDYSIAESPLYKDGSRFKTILSHEINYSDITLTQELSGQT